MSRSPTFLLSECELERNEAREQVRVLRVALERIRKLDDGFFNETKGRIALHLARAALESNPTDPDEGNDDE